jgi:hypothetical protein
MASQRLSGPRQWLITEPYYGPVEVLKHRYAVGKLIMNEWWTMLSGRNYTWEEVDDSRAMIAAQLASYKMLVQAVGIATAEKKTPIYRG